MFFNRRKTNKLVFWWNINEFGLFYKECLYSCTGPAISNCLESSNEENLNNNFSNINVINEIFDPNIAQFKFKNHISNNITLFDNDSHLINLYIYFSFKIYKH